MPEVGTMIDVSDYLNFQKTGIFETKAPAFFSNRAFFDKLPIAISIVSNGLVQYANRKCLDLLKMKESSELVGTNAIDWVIPEYRTELLTKFKIDNKDYNYTVEHEVYLFRKDGSAYNVHLNVNSVCSFEKTYALVFMTEINKKKIVENQYEQEYRFIKILENINTPVWIYDANAKRFKYINNALERLFEISANEFYSDPSIIEKLVHPDDMNKIRIGWQSENCTFEFRTLREPGEVRWYNCNRTAIMKTESNPRLFIGFITDITQTKNAIEKELQYQRQLIQTDKLASLGLLVSGIAHEINNPNNYISLSAPLLRKAWSTLYPLLDKYKEETKNLKIGAMAFSEFVENIEKLLKGIEDGSKRIKRIVADLKDYSRNDTYNKKCPMGINAVVKSAVTLMDPMIKKYTKNFSMFLTEEDLIVEGNFQRLEQVIVNLIHNACDALSDSGQVIIIRTERQDADLVAITITDSGCGIQPEHLEKLTDPFFTTKQEKGGTGLGLSVSDGIVRDHNGKLLFKSELGKGTEVTVLLPLEKKNV